MRRITPAIILKATRLRSSGLFWTIIAERFGVSESGLRHACARAVKP